MSKRWFFIFFSLLCSSFTLYTTYIIFVLDNVTKLQSDRSISNSRALSILVEMKMATLVRFYIILLYLYKPHDSRILHRKY